MKILEEYKFLFCQTSNEVDMEKKLAYIDKFIELNHKKESKNLEEYA